LDNFCGGYRPNIKSNFISVWAVGHYTELHLDKMNKGEKTLIAPKLTLGLTLTTMASQHEVAEDHY
jgi:hypothetical protein